MTVRILVGENEELKELAEEFPKEASIIAEMLKAAEADSDEEESDPDTKAKQNESVDA